MKFDLEAYTDELKAAQTSTFAEIISIAIDGELPEIKRVAYFEAASSKVRQGTETEVYLQTLLDFLRDRSGLIQRFAILNCRGRVNTAVRALLWGIATTDCENKLLALLELVHAKDESALDWCLRNLHQFEYDQKAQVIATIGLIRSSSSTASLEHEYQRTTNEGLRSSLALAISRCGGEISNALLANHVKSVSQEEGVPLVCELAARCDPLGVSLLKILLADQNIAATALWRSLCIADLIDSQDPEWRTNIKSWINDFDDSVDSREKYS